MLIIRRSFYQRNNNLLIMDQKSKPVTTSVPSIAIKFHANAEQLEELYGSDDDNSTADTKSDKTASTIGESESSPLKYLPRLVKRSTSIDVSSQNLDSSPPSDPWRFFSDIKGKITKSVEEKITEIKSRNNEDSSGSPYKSKKDTSKENSSLSDSEDLSESSISKTCGIVSTTEGVEMSSDDDTPSLDKDTKTKSSFLSPGSGLRHRFKFLKSKGSSKEGTVNVNNLSKIYNINTEKVEQALPEHSDDVESGVDALEEGNLNTDFLEHERKISNDDIVKAVASKIDNFEIDSENSISIREVTGKEIRESFLNNPNDTKTVFAPSGFVDLRLRQQIIEKDDKHKYYFFRILLPLLVLLYVLLQVYLPYMAGFMAGLLIAFTISYFYIKYYAIQSTSAASASKSFSSILGRQIYEVPAIKEYQPIMKYEGWINEYPEVYDPHTYHILKTQSVYVRLQGNLLRLSHSKQKVPKRAMWNEPEIKPTFTHHRIYNLIGAKICLLPEGLAKTRHWSKKYPICIILSKDQMNFDPEVMSKFEDEDKEKFGSKCLETDKSKEKSGGKEKRSFRFRKRVGSPSLTQRFSKLTEDDEEFELESDSRASSPSPDISDDSPPAALNITSSTTAPVDEPSLPQSSSEVVNEEEFHDILDDWSNVSPGDSPSEIRIYIFGRTDREKEDWYRRLTAATHNKESSQPNSDDSISESTLPTETTIDEYMKYMQTYIKPPKKLSKSLKLAEESEKVDSEDTNEEVKTISDHVLWLNAFMGRVLFDCVRDDSFITRVRDRIQRKLGAIKLPYFIEELLITELSLGKTSPMLEKTGKPLIDDRGLWVDIDLNYEGLIVLTLQTKVNLMKLKNPHANEKPVEVRSAMFHSDVDDSAESSSDEDLDLNSSMDSLNSSTSGTTTSNSSKKFIKMVDRIAESKFFQAATENRYIKKAMEGVSNTELRLKVEVRGIFGTLVLNIPPPPSDRVWIGFRPTPELLISAHPIVGERNITFLMVTGWIEKKLVQEFQKIMVIPNMEDFIIPVMNPKLPE